MTDMSPTLTQTEKEKQFTRFMSRWKAGEIYKINQSLIISDITNSYRLKFKEGDKFLYTGCTESPFGINRHITWIDDQGKTTENKMYLVDTPSSNGESSVARYFDVPVWWKHAQQSFAGVRKEAAHGA